MSSYFCTFHTGSFSLKYQGHAAGTETSTNEHVINVFKKKAARKSGDFIVHCMMDEIGRLHPNNIKGILQFANSRNIYLINSSPTSYNPYDYRYTYLLSKHGVKTRVEKLLKRTT